MRLFEPRDHRRPAVAACRFGAIRARRPPRRRGTRQTSRPRSGRHMRDDAVGSAASATTDQKEQCRKRMAHQPKRSAGRSRARDRSTGQPQERQHSAAKGGTRDDCPRRGSHFPSSYCSLVPAYAASSLVFRQGSKPQAETAVAGSVHESPSRAQNLPQQFANAADPDWILQT